MSNERSDFLTVAGCALAAYAACDLVHELLGHGIAAFFVDGVRVVSLSSVALQTTGVSRTVAAAGSIANVAVGIVAMALFRRRPAASAYGYFLWLLASLNLLNGTGYPLYSAVLGSGDWMVVAGGLAPDPIVRIALAIVGIAGYAASIRIAARALPASSDEAARVVFPAYIAGGPLLVAAAALNPISPMLILTSGVASGFAAMAGLTLVPRLVLAKDTGFVVPRSRAWIAAGFVLAALFIAVIGPGVAL